MLWLQGQKSKEFSILSVLQQQMQAQHLPHAHAPPIPMPPHPGGLPAPGLPPGSNAGLLGLAGASGLIGGHLPGVKDEKGLYANGNVANSIENNVFA